MSLEKYEINRYMKYAAEIEAHWKIKEQDRFRFHSQSPQLQLRPDLITWLKRVSERLNLANTTLHLAVYLVDFFMDNHTITVDRLGLVALVCLMLAAKFEDVDNKVPKVSELNVYEGHRYPKTDFVLLELMILRFFNWSLAQPTVAHFAEYYFTQAVTVDDFSQVSSFKHLHINAHRTLCRFIDVSLLERTLLLYRPSRVAAACILATRRTLHLQPCWSTSLVAHTGYEEAALEDCYTIIINANRVGGSSRLKRKLDSSDDGYSSTSPSSENGVTLTK